jgi:alkanesulfonate monooxygenase SsuD/methylene tetrahydromethanopterin reductase-like flavin-dependent oxidoreductase (luciferase family)
VLEDLGIAFGPASADLAASEVDEAARAAIDAGFDSLWSLDNPLADQAEPLTFLGFVAARHPALKVGTAAVVGPVREPILLAKQVATLDRLTGGDRVTLGLTIGRRPSDYEVIGRAFGQRGRALDDVVRVVRQCWAGERLDVDGTQAWSSDEPVGLRPITPGGPPLLLGGQAEGALLRAVRLGDGYLAPATGGPTTAKHNAARLDSLRGASSVQPSFRLVANVFVTVAATTAEAVQQATAVFTARHGSPPPWDPNDVIVGGEPPAIADGLAELVDVGFVGLNLVPVIPSTEQIRALATVAGALRTSHPATPAPR